MEQRAEVSQPPGCPLSPDKDQECGRGKALSVVVFWGRIPGVWEMRISSSISSMRRGWMEKGTWEISESRDCLGWKRPLETTQPGPPGAGDTGTHPGGGTAAPARLSRQFWMERFCYPDPSSLILCTRTGEGSRGCCSSTNGVFAWQGEPQAVAQTHPGWSGKCLMP